MKTTLRKALALLLCLVMCFSMLPLSALAEEPEDEAPVEDVQEPADNPAEDPTNNPAEFEGPEQSEEPEASEEQEEPEASEEAVQVVFSCNPAETKITVYESVYYEDGEFVPALNEDDEPVVIAPEEDGSYLLLPGTYLYDAECEGYERVEKAEFAVSADMELTHTVTLVLVEGESVNPSGAEINADGINSYSFTTFEGLETLCAQSYSELTVAFFSGATGSSLTIKRNLTIPQNLTVRVTDGEYELIVPSGNTLIINGSLRIDNLTLRGVIKPVGNFTEGGAYTTALSVDGSIVVDGGQIDLVGLASIAVDSWPALVLACISFHSNSYLVLRPTQSFVINSSFSLPSDMHLHIWSTDETYKVTAANGMTITVNPSAIFSIQNVMLQVNGTFTNNGLFYMSTGHDEKLSVSGRYTGTGNIEVGDNDSENFDPDSRLEGINLGQFERIASAGYWTYRYKGGTSTTYTISYDANGGTGAPASQTKTHGTALTLSSTKPTRTGYDFLGWALDEAATAAQYQPGASYTAEGDATLYAVWKKNGGSTVVASGTCGKNGDNLTWTLDSEGTLTISGTGEMEDYQASNALDVPWYAYTYRIYNVVISDGVTSVGKRVFTTCDKLISIEIPSSVTTLYTSAFGGCEKLTNITVNAANQVYCSLNGVLFNSDATILLYFPRGKSGEYVIPNGVSSISSAFQNCTLLTSVTIPEGVTSIEIATFGGCASLRSITIPSSVNSIGVSSFSGCTALADVYFAGTQEQWNAITVSEDNDPLLNATLHCSSSAVIASGVFGEDGDNLTWTLNSDGLLTISGSGNMEDFYIGEILPWNSYISNIISVEIESGVTSIGDMAFMCCDSLMSAAIAASVTRIGRGAFYECSCLTSVTIPGSVISIGDWAFSYCSSLKNVAIGDSVTSIGFGAFEECSSLTDIYYSGTQAQWNSVSIGDNNTPLLNANIHFNIIAFGACGNNLTWNLDSDGVLTISGSGDMEDFGNAPSTPWAAIRSEIKKVIINPGVTSIGQRAFSMCSNLTSVIIPEGVTSIGAGAFNNCGLTSVTIPEGVTSIFATTFWYCSALTSVTIPASVTSISNAFAKCFALTDVYFCGTQTQWDKIDISTSESQLLNATLHILAFTITYDSNGGTGAPAAQTKTHGIPLTLSTIRPIRTGYDFLGWATSSTATSAKYQPGASYTEEGDVTLYAVWRIKTYTITYNANGGSGLPGNQTKTHDVALTLSSTVPTRANATAGSYTVTLNPNGGSVSPTSLSAARTTSYSFKNWNTAQNGVGTSYNPGASYTANASVTLYAQWNSSTSTAAVNLPTPTRTGYAFLGWGTSSAATTGVTGSYTPSGNVTLYAIWSVNAYYTVSYNANGGTGEPANQTKTHDVALTLSSTVPTRANATAGSYTVTLNPNGGSVSPTSLSAARTTSYSFKNWNTAQNGVGTSYNPGASYTANASVTLYAQWNSSTSTAAVNLPTPTRTGYAFLGWGTSSAATTGVTGSYTPSGNVTLYAIWSVNTYYMVSYDANSGTGAPEQQTKTHDVVLTLSSTIPTRANATAGSYKVTLNANGGSVSPASLSAARTTKYSFKNWNTAQNGSGTSYNPGASYTVNASVTLYAQWNSSTSTASVSLPTPTRTGYAFIGWGTSSSATTSVTGSYTPSGNVTLYALWNELPLLDLPETFTLDRNYVLLEKGKTVQLAADGLDGAFAGSLLWTVSADGSPNAGTGLPISVSKTGLVTAKSKGTAYAVAYLSDGNGKTVSASCRIDVTESGLPTGVRLLETKATVELYQTDYAQISVILELMQNISSAQGDDTDAAVPNSGKAVESARFADAETAARFELSVVDDRTLEIVPREEFVTTNTAVLKMLKGSYKSAVAITVAGKEYTTPEMLTLTVKKTQPKLTAKIAKFNSFNPGDTQPIVFTGGVPAKVTVQAKPGWLSVDTDALTATYTDGPDLSKSDKLFLMVQPEGWDLELPVSVAVSAVPTAPKLTLKPATVSVQPGAVDAAIAEATLSPASFADPKSWPIKMVSVMEGSNVTPDALDVAVTGYGITVRAGTNAPTDGKAHTYKVTLALLRDGKVSSVQTTLTVKLLTTSSKVTVTAKASGNIDTAIPQSPVTVTLTPKNVNGGSVQVTEVTVSGAKGKAAPEDVTDRFEWEADGLTVTLRQAEGKSLDASLSYTATIKTSVGADATAKLTVKASDPNKVKPSVTLKASGFIDVIRPASAVTVTPTVKNCFTYEPKADDLHIWKVQGKSYTDASDKFDISVENGVFVMRLKAGSGVDHTKDKFAVSLRATLDGIAIETGKTAISVKMGTAKLTQSAKAVTLLKDDRFSRGTVTVSAAEAGLSEIDWERSLKEFVSPVDKAKQPLFALANLGGGTVAIGYAGNTLKDFKSATVKIPVYFVGNNSTKPNATVSVSVKLG